MGPVAATMSSIARAVCSHVPFDESGRPIHEAAQQPMPRSEEQKLAFDGAGGCPGRRSHLVGCDGGRAAISTRVDG
jgi:hypothetical protein